MAGYTHMSVVDVEDAAQKFGMSETQESRFAHGAFGAEQTGFTFHRYKPGKRQPFGHRHERQEEHYVVVAGSGAINVDGEIVPLRAWDAVRVPASAMRALEAGPDGLEFLAFGAPLGESPSAVTEADWWD